MDRGGFEIPKAPHRRGGHVGAYCNAVVSLSLVISLVACGAPGESIEGAALCDDSDTFKQLFCDEYPGPASVEVGRGSKLVGFVPIEDGSELPWQPGPVGMSMLELAIKALEVYPGRSGRLGHALDPSVEVEVWHDDMLVADVSALNQGFASSPDYYELAGIWAIFRDFDLIPKLIGETLTLRVSVVDACGNSAVDETIVVLVDP